MNGAWRIHRVIAVEHLPGEDPAEHFGDADDPEEWLIPAQKGSLHCARLTLHDQAHVFDELVDRVDRVPDRGEYESATEAQPFLRPQTALDFLESLEA